MNKCDECGIQTPNHGITLTLCKACYGLLEALCGPGSVNYRPFWKAADAEYNAEIRRKQALISGEGYIER